MTQQAVATAPVTPAAAPVVDAAVRDQGEPTIEELAALLPEPEAEPLVDVAAETAEPADGEPATPAADPVVEEPVVEPDTTEVDAALARATKAAERARAGSRRYAETQRKLSEETAQRERAASEADQLRRANQQHAQREAAFKQDPYKALKDAGMTDVQLAERAMRENTPEAELMRVREEVKAEREARLALEQKLETQAQEARSMRAESEFIDAARDADAYPELAGRKPAAQLWAAREALKQIQARGHRTSHFSNAQIAEAADLWLTDWLATDAKAKAAPAAKPAAVAAKPAIAKPSGITLTNKLAQTRTVAPATWESLTEEQQIAHLASQLPDPT